MKNILLTFLALSLVTAAFSQATGVKQLMLEEFTQASCGPCASQNPAFNALIQANDQGQNGFIVNSLKYQVSWPGTDPMYNQNEAEVDARVSFYGVNGVPDAKLNGFGVAGSSYFGAPANITQTTLNNASTAAAPIEVDVVWDWANPQLTAINITVTVSNTNSGANFTAANKLQVVIVEEEITFSSPPGSNGETDFFMIMRDMLPAHNGTALGTVTAASPSVFTFTNQPVPNNFYDLTKLGVVAFVQNSSSKEVFNSEYQTNLGFPPSTGTTPADMTITSNSIPLNNHCDATYTPSATVENTNNFTLDTFAVTYVLDNNSPVTQVVTTPLAAGASTTVNFPPTTITTSSNFVYTYDFTTYNNTLVDVQTLNNAAYDDGPFALLSTFSAVGTSISTTFDGMTNFSPAPSNAIAVNPDDVPAFTVNNAVSSAVTWPLGGFGNSTTSFLWDFYFIPSGRSSSIVYEKVDFSAVPTNATLELKWSHAYAQKLFFSTDKLDVKVSTDCGATWTNVWSKSGADLKTVPAVTNSRYFAGVADWIADVADISAFIGEPEVLIAFEGTSNNGNSLFIDDINTEVTLGVGTNAIQNPTTAFSVYPNPVGNEMTLEFSVETATDMSISIVNALGQTVQQIANSNFNGANKLTINTAALTSGVYFINAITNDGVVSQRFVIEK